MSSCHPEFGAGIARLESVQEVLRAGSRRNALVRVVADGDCSRCGDLHRSSQPADSELAGAAFSGLRDRCFDLAGWLARRGTESLRSGSRAADLRVSVLDGRNGRGRCEVVRSNWGVDWPIPVDFGIGDDWTGGRLE